MASDMWLQESGTTVCTEVGRATQIILGIYPTLLFKVKAEPSETTHAVKALGFPSLYLSSVCGSPRGPFLWKCLAVLWTRPQWLSVFSFQCTSLGTRTLLSSGFDLNQPHWRTLTFTLTHEVCRMSQAGGGDNYLLVSHINTYKLNTRTFS